MRITIDTALCNGYGNCVITAPDVFDLDPTTDIAVVRDQNAADLDPDAVREAAADCPVRAIRLGEA